MSPVLNISIDVEQINYILQLLSKQPYGEVAELIASIHRQATEQTMPKQDDPDLS
jgi:hypothetical protein